MNSEELEQSLRTEFEGYLKNILADMTQEVSQFQQKIDTELEKHKSHLDGVFQEFSARIQSQRDLDAGFRESVVEHLRLARDEGARITATAIAEAEELTKSEMAEATETKPSVELGDIRDAINDISSQNSQSSILKSLITHAAKFTPRGAFFVVKNQHFVGWRVFGKEENIEVDAITDIVFPLTSSTILGESVNSLGAIESTFGTYADDTEYLKQLEFSDPERIFAIPLIARGRGVAAIYADDGVMGDRVNLEALETLVSVAGLTVELLAAAQNSNYSREPARASTFVAPPQTVISSEESEPVSEENVYEQPQTAEASEDDFADDSAANVETASYDVAESDVEEVEEIEESYSVVDSESTEIAEDDAEEVTYLASEDSDDDELSTASTEDSVYEIDEIESMEVSEVETTESFDEAETVESPTVNYGFVSDDGSVENEADYAVYDDDLIEEVQTQSVSSEDGSEFDMGDSIEVETVQVVEEQTETFATQSGWESDSEIYEAAVQETEDTDTSGDFASPAEFTEFETNQDFNSTPVQFETSVDNIDSGSLVSPEPAVSDAPEEVSISEPQASDVKDFSVESFVEEISQPAEPTPVPVVKTRFSDRNLDLPIEVSEDERRLHNDARRFARLLVSEIKLYNEQKVKEGRDASDLYERLREALDRSREMYDKRVQPAVVEKFDYFHFEVVNTLAEGEEAKLGAAYPGAAVAA